MDQGELDEEQEQQLEELVGLSEPAPVLLLCSGASRFRDSTGVSTGGTEGGVFVCVFHKEKTHHTKNIVAPPLNAGAGTPTPSLLALLSPHSHTHTLSLSLICVVWVWMAAHPQFCLRMPSWTGTTCCCREGREKAEA